VHGGSQTTLLGINPHKQRIIELLSIQLPRLFYIFHSDFFSMKNKLVYTGKQATNQPALPAIHDPTNHAISPAATTK
jgi:hypothetical protein